MKKKRNIILLLIKWTKINKYKYQNYNSNIPFNLFKHIVCTRKKKCLGQQHALNGLDGIT